MLARTMTLAAVALLGASAFASSSISLSEKATLQAAMQTHIDRSLVDGAFLRLNETTGEVEPLRPAAAHPVILKMGKYFVLCSDFRSESGATVNVDFFLAPKGNGYMVFDQQVENRALVERLMQSGLAERVD